MIRRRNKKTKLLSRSKARYKFNAGFAKDTKKRSRRAYRKSKGGEFELDGNTVLRALGGTLHDSTEVLLVTNSQDSDTPITARVMRPTKLAELLNIAYQTIWRWTSTTDQLPNPILIDSSLGRDHGVYHVDEAYEIIRILGEHFKKFRYYRNDHTGTKQSLFTAIEQIRSTKYKTEKVQHGTKS